MILGREACNGAWESLSWKPRRKQLEFLKGGGGNLDEEEDWQTGTAFWVVSLVVFSLVVRLGVA
jgi:hypothetical protein